MEARGDQGACRWSQVAAAQRTPKQATGGVGGPLFGTRLLHPQGATAPPSRALTRRAKGCGAHQQHSKHGKHSASTSTAAEPAVHCQCQTRKAPEAPSMPPRPGKCSRLPRERGWLCRHGLCNGGASHVLGGLPWMVTIRQFRGDEQDAVLSLWRSG